VTLPKVVYLPDAVQDLHAIWVYVAEQSQSLDIADRLIDSIDDAATVYAANPEMGTSRLELSASLRCFVVGRYVAFYVPTPAGIEVIQIIHGSRDIPVHFRRSPK
jgi:toxin ParE1/3/4